MLSLNIQTRKGTFQKMPAEHYACQGQFFFSEIYSAPQSKMVSEVDFSNTLFMESPPKFSRKVNLQTKRIEYILEWNLVNP